jgi:hypothetical protein
MSSQLVSSLSMSGIQDQQQQLLHNRSCNAVGGSSTLSSLRSLMTATSCGAMQPDADDACAETILENHFRRIWDASFDDDFVIGRNASDVDIHATRQHQTWASTRSAQQVKSRACGSAAVAGSKAPADRWSSSWLWRRHSSAVSDSDPLSVGANQSTWSVPELTTGSRLLPSTRMSTQPLSSSAVAHVGRDDRCLEASRQSTAVIPKQQQRTIGRLVGTDDDADDDSSDARSSAVDSLIARCASAAVATAVCRASTPPETMEAYIPADSDATAALHDAVRRLERPTTVPRVKNSGSGGPSLDIDCGRWSALSSTDYGAHSPTCVVAGERYRRLRMAPLHVACRCRTTPGGSDRLRVDRRTTRHDADLGEVADSR